MEEEIEMLRISPWYGDRKKDKTSIEQWLEKVEEAKGDKYNRTIFYYIVVYLF
jgi:hypothetical protein